MKVIKRNGSEVLYNQQKIKDAVSKANAEVSRVERLSQAQITAIANNVTKIVEQSTHAVSIEDIQNYVEKEIMAMRGYEVAQKYITYRYKRALARQSNTTDERILSIIGLENEEVKQENANKNPTINSTQRDYMAGEVSKDLTTRILLPQDIVDAHNNGLIHFHDADYYAQKMHNCFTGDTKFMTHKGAKRFDSFKDGESVFVRDMHNEIRKATVHIYGEQRVQKVTFKMLGKNKKKTVKCTPNHRWILEDKKVTTALKIGDVLFSNSYSHYEKWKVEKIEFKGIEKVYCVEEPITHSFTLEDGMVTGNCDLINLEDMLQNGTVISGTMIEKPHSFHTACNITTQVIAQVASSQFGGQSFSLAHLVPFVDISRKKIKKEILEENLINKIVESDEIINKKVEFRLKDEVRRGIQTIQYQILTLMTTNGQAPFVTMFLWLDEVEDGQARDDMAMLIEEVLNQRIQGVKNEKGVYITPAFPKVIYLLDDDNIHEDSKYYYLTELAAKCTAKRMVPDYISGKVMRELKDGDIYPCMGCVDGFSIIEYKVNNKKYITTIKDAWNMLSKTHLVKKQPNKKDDYIDTENVKIFDCVSNKYVDNYRIIRNTQSKWYHMIFENNQLARSIDVTDNHPFEVIDKGIVLAKDLQIGDKIYATDNTIVSLSKKSFYEEKKYSYDVTTETEHFTVSGLYSHNCRSFLTVDRTKENLANAKNYNPNRHKYYGRFNQGVVTINLVDVACSSYGDMNKFWEILDERLELCHRTLKERHKRLLGTPSDVAPILWQHGALARLKKGEKIDKLLYDGYSTISLGYAGLYEMCMRMTGKSHTDPEAKPFALAVMQKLNDKCNEWKEKENIDYSLYGTPKSPRVAQ